MGEVSMHIWEQSELHVHVSWYLHRLTVAETDGETADSLWNVLLRSLFHFADHRKKHVATRPPKQSSNHHLNKI